jgi:limonene-1,2-epoxide hydrolase
VTDPKPEDVVKRYLESLGPTAEDFWGSFDTFFDDKTVWENVGMARTVGREEAITFARSFPVDFAYMTVEDLTLAASGNTVFAERIDHFVRADGKIMLTIRVNGVFLVEGLKLREWRDYFDTAGIAAAVTALNV